MSKEVLNEINRMKSLVNYKRGIVISEQLIIEANNPNAYYESTKKQYGNRTYDEYDLIDADGSKISPYASKQSIKYFAKDVFPNKKPNEWPKTVSSDEMYGLTLPNNSLGQKGYGQGVKPISTSTVPLVDKVGGYEPSFQLPEYQTEGLKKYPEPLASRKTRVKVRGEYIPAQTDTHYWNTSTWVQKTPQNVDEWRSVPSGFAPKEYNEYLKKLDEINKIYPKDSKIKLPDYSGKGVNISPISAKKQAILNLRLIYYNKNYPLGLTRQDKEELLSQLDATNQYYQNQLKQIYGDPNLKRGDYFASQHSKQIKGRETEIKTQQNIAIDNIQSQYDYWKEVKEPEPGFDWITVIGFAMYLCPYTAAFAPYFQSMTGLYKAGVAYDNGDMKKASFETLFSLLPLGTVGKTIKSVNLLNAVDKVISQQTLNVAEVETLNILQKNSSLIKSELNNAASSLLKKLPTEVEEEAKKWTEAMINKAYKEGEKQLGFYDDLKKKLKSGAKEQQLDKKLI